MSGGIDFVIRLEEDPSAPQARAEAPAAPAAEGLGIKDLFSGGGFTAPYAQSIWDRVEAGKRVLMSEIAGSLEAALQGAADQAKLHSAEDVRQFIDDFQYAKALGRPLPGAGVQGPATPRQEAERVAAPPPAGAQEAAPALTDAERRDLARQFGAKQAAEVEQALQEQGAVAPPPTPRREAEKAAAPGPGAGTGQEGAGGASIPGPDANAAAAEATPDDCRCFAEVEALLRGIGTDVRVLAGAEGPTSGREAKGAQGPPWLEALKYVTDALFGKRQEQPDDCRCFDESEKLLAGIAQDVRAILTEMGGTPAPEAPREDRLEEVGGGEEGAGGSALGTAAAVAAGVAAVAGLAKGEAAAFDAVRESAKAAAEGLTRFAANDNLGAMTGAADRAGAALGRIPIVGGAAESAIKLVTGSFQSANAVIDAFVNRGKELSAYSGPLSAAGAMAEVRSLLGDIREAGELGPDLAKLTDAQSRLSEELRELLLPIKKVVVEYIAESLSTIADNVRDVKLHWEETKVVLQAIQGLLDSFLKGDFDGMRTALSDMAGSLRGLRDEAARKREWEKFKTMDGVTREFLDLLDRNKLPDAFGDFIGGAGGVGTPQIPGFGGF